MSRQEFALRRSLGDYLEVVIPSGESFSEVVNLQPAAYGGFILPAAVDAHVISFAPQVLKNDPASDYELLRLDGSAYGCLPVADGAYALPGALFGHRYFRFKLAGSAAAERVILVHLGN